MCIEGQSSRYIYFELLVSGFLLSLLLQRWARRRKLGKSLGLVDIGNNELGQKEVKE